MLNSASIKNTDELEFAVFCIENIAARFWKNAEEVYQALTEKSDILNSYIIPELRCCIPKVKTISWMILSA